MIQVRTISIRLCPNTVYLAGGDNKAEILKHISDKHGFHFSETDVRGNIVEGQDDFGSKCNVIFLQSRPENERARVILLAAWLATVASSLIKATVDGLEVEKKSAFWDICYSDLVSAAYSLWDGDLQEKSTLKRSVSKLVIPVKKAGGKCTTDAGKALAEETISKAMAAPNKKAAIAIIEAAKSNDLLRPFWEDDSDTKAETAPTA
jgi:hypothetical protein